MPTSLVFLHACSLFQKGGIQEVLGFRVQGWTPLCSPEGTHLFGDQGRSWARGGIPVLSLPRPLPHLRLQLQLLLEQGLHLGLGMCKRRKRHTQAGQQQGSLAFSCRAGIAPESGYAQQGLHLGLGRSTRRKRHKQTRHKQGSIAFSCRA